MEQVALWHDSLHEALRDCLPALGGPKRAAALLWPALPIEQASRRLNHCLDPERAEKISLNELLLLLNAARQAGCHVAMHTLCDLCSYARPEPVTPEQRRTDLQRQFLQQARELRATLASVERLEAQLRSVS